MFVAYYLGVTTLGYLRTASRLYELMFQVLVNPILSVSVSSLTARVETWRSYTPPSSAISGRFDVFDADLRHRRFDGEEIIHLVAGKKWDGAILPFRLFASPPRLWR